MGGAGSWAATSPRADRSFKQHDGDRSSPPLEETSILSNATDEGLDVSQRLTESIFTGPDIDAEGEEIVTDARGRLHTAVTRLLEMIERTTQQLLEAKATQTDLLETLAARSRDNDDLEARLHDLEEQVRQEVSAKEYLGLELHKAEGLISGYSSEREAMEEQVQLLEEQKEVLASDLELTRSRLQDFQEAAGELEARRLDVERQRTLLQDHAGQETRELPLASGDATVSKQTALLHEMDSLKQESREQSLQLQHRLSQAERRLQERESILEEMEREQRRQVEELRRQVEDLKLQLENAERQLRSNKQFLDEQMSEREQEREDFQKDVQKLKTLLQDREKQTDTERHLQHEIQDLTEQLQARLDSQTALHRQVHELQQLLQERDLSAQDLRVWIDSLEKELDQRGDTEQQLKGHIQKLERRLTVGSEGDDLSDTCESPELTPRPDSPDSQPMSPTLPVSNRRESRISLEAELKRAKHAEEELVHEKEALQKRVHEQLLQISALRNQLDVMRHWPSGQGSANTTASSTLTAGDLRYQLDEVSENLEKAQEELLKARDDREQTERELYVRTLQSEELKQQLQEIVSSSQRVAQLEEERKVLQDRVTSLQDAGPFPPELLDEKNAEIEELRQHLKKAETDMGAVQAELREKEELVSDLQDAVHSLQRGESCLDVSLSFNQPLPLNSSFTERLSEERSPSVTSLAQELDQTVGEKETQISQLVTELEELTSRLRKQEHYAEQLQSELKQRDDDLTQLQEDKMQKQEALVEKEFRHEQLLEQVNSLQTEISSLTSFQEELQKDFDTVQLMLDEKERESLTKELLESRSHDGSDVSESLRSELETLKAQLMEKDEQMEKGQLEKEQMLEKERKLRAELEREVEEMQQAKRSVLSRASSLPNLTQRPLQDQMCELKAEVFHLETALRDKEELIVRLQSEGDTNLSQKDSELNHLRLQLSATHDNLASREAELLAERAQRDRRLADAETLESEEILKLQMEAKDQTQKTLQLEMLNLGLQQVVQEQRSAVDRLQGQVDDLQEELQQAKGEITATDDVKALQERLHLMTDQVSHLERQLALAQTRLSQTCTQLAEREEQLQQLQTEVQDCAASPATVSSYTRTPNGSREDTEMETSVKDVLSRAQHMQRMVHSSLATSLPLGAGMALEEEEEVQVQSLSRWESEPGLSSRSCEIMEQAHLTSEWMRRQQRELAAKNRELAAVRMELELWLRRKERSAVATPIGGQQFTTSIMSMTLRLQEKETLIASLKRELVEAKELLASAEQPSAVSQSLSLETQQQIHHPRSELRLARSALSALQESQSAPEREVTEQGQGQEDGERLIKMEEEPKLLRSSATLSAIDFVKKVQELREELREEHRCHLAKVQETAQRDLEMKLQELASQHARETQQMQQLQQRRLQQALDQQQQHLEKEHQTEVNRLTVMQHRMEMERLQNEEITSVDSSVTQRLHADVTTTQQMDHRMIGTLNSTADDASDTASRASEACPPHIQALLDRLREAGEHILSVSELNLLRRHLTPPREHPGGEESLQKAWEDEKVGFFKTIQALKDLLSQADRISAGMEEGEAKDWRANLIHYLGEVYRAERQGLEAELHTLRQQTAGQEYGSAIRSFDNRLKEQEQLQRSGLDAMLRADRQSLLSELESLRSIISQLRRDQQDLRTNLTESLAQHEENASSKTWKLQREVQVLEYKLQQEKVLEEDLRKTLEAERRRLTELSAELSRDKSTLISVQSELQSVQLHQSRTKDALEREQNRFTSVTLTQEAGDRDALEEEREKNNHLIDKLEALRRQYNSVETDAGRSEAMRRERENADAMFLKQLQTELAEEREQHQKVLEVAEEERHQRKQLQTQFDSHRQQSNEMRQELDKLRQQAKRAIEGETAKLADLQRQLSEEKERHREWQRLLADKESVVQQVQSQVEELQHQCWTLTRELQAEKARQASLAAMSDKEREQQTALQQQEEGVSKQLRHNLSLAKSEAGEVRRHLEQEKLQNSNLRLELDRAQSELRALTEHAGTTERHLETEHSNTWSQLRVAQRERDDLQVKVQELELELDRLQDRLQDLELELDRSRQRELEARHDVERQKLYVSAGPHSTQTTPRSSSDPKLQSRLHTFCQQLQTIGKRLHTLTIQQREHNASFTHSDDGDAAAEGKRKSPVETLMAELQILRQKMASVDQVDSVLEPVTLTQELEVLQVTVTQLQHEKEEQWKEKEKLQVRLTQLQKAIEELRVTVTQLQQEKEVQRKEKEELQVRLSQLQKDQGTVAQVQKEKEELLLRLTLLEDEDNRRITPRTSAVAVAAVNTSGAYQEQMPQYVSDATNSDEEGLYERTVWASERLNLQLALDSAEREIDRLKKELHSFRGRFNSEGFMIENDREKIQRLYGKYLRAESFRKALVYQKKYLLLLLGGYQDSEQETLAVIATMGGQPSSTLDLVRRRQHHRYLTMFRSAARMVVAIFRMKFLVKKWRRAMRVGSPVVSGSVHQQYGYVAAASSFSAVNNTELPHPSSATSIHLHTLTRNGTQRSSSASKGSFFVAPSHTASLEPRGAFSLRKVGETGRRFYTPPTKESGQSQRASSSSSSSSARRQLMSELEQNQHSSSGTDDGGDGVRGAVGGRAGGSDQDDFIQRLEKLQTKLSHNGQPHSQDRSSWR